MCDCLTGSVICDCLTGNSPQRRSPPSPDEIAPTTAGHVTLFFNCLSNVAGIVVPPATGYIKHRWGSSCDLAEPKEMPCKVD